MSLIVRQQSIMALSIKTHATNSAQIGTQHKLISPTSHFVVYCVIYYCLHRVPNAHSFFPALSLTISYYQRQGEMQIQPRIAFWCLHHVLEAGGLLRGHEVSHKQGEEAICIKG